MNRRPEGERMTKKEGRRGKSLTAPYQKDVISQSGVVVTFPAETRQVPKGLKGVVRERIPYMRVLTV